MKTVVITGSSSGIGKAAATFQPCDRLKKKRS